MQDLNDLLYFVRVVEHRGFAPAARALGVQKSKLSRRVGELESRLGVKLIHRSSRSFSVTEVGQEYYRQCLSMIAGADAAQAVIDKLHSEPQGVIKLTCPPGLSCYLFSDLISDFMASYPLVQVQLKAFNRRVDVIAEGYDLAIRSGLSQRDHSGLVVRKLRSIPVILVGSPQLIGDRAPAAPADLDGLPSLDFGLPRDEHRWCLQHADGTELRIRHQPRFVSDDLFALREAALRGIGIVPLPLPLIEADIAAGRVIRLLPDWRLEDETICAVFPSRRGLLPSIRALLDFLSAAPRAA